MIELWILPSHEKHKHLEGTNAIGHACVQVLPALVSDGWCDSLKLASCLILLIAATFLRRREAYRASAMLPSALSLMWCQCTPSLGAFVLSNHHPASFMLFLCYSLLLSFHVSTVPNFTTTASPSTLLGMLILTYMTFLWHWHYSFLSSLCPRLSSKFSSCSFIQEFCLN